MHSCTHRSTHVTRNTPLLARGLAGEYTSDALKAPSRRAGLLGETLGPRAVLFEAYSGEYRLDPTIIPGLQLFTRESSPLQCTREVSK